MESLLRGVYTVEMTASKNGGEFNVQMMCSNEPPTEMDEIDETSWCSKDATLESECGQFESARKELCCAMIHFVRNEALEYTPFAEPRRLRSVFSDWELDQWVDNLDDGDIDYFYDLMVNGQTDDIMDAFRYDVEYGDYGEYNDCGQYDDNYYDNYYDIQ